MSTPSQFSVSTEGSITTVAASGELDLAARDALRDALAPLTGTVVVDLGQVTFLDSSCIGVIAGAGQRLHERGGDLRLRNPADVPRRALEITGLEIWIDD
jgi:anti-sigma B factor antagonist